MRKYFGTDGLRGQTNRFPVTAETALRLGQAAGRVFRRGSHRHRVVIGKDTRLSGYMMESALVAGLTSMGMDAFLFGPLPTPAVSFLTRSLRADLGVMISASHNGFRDNGIKLFGPDGFKLSDEEEMEIESHMDAGLADHLVSSDRIGRATRIDDAQTRYIEFAKNSFPKDLTLEGVRIVIDCAHGAGYKVAPAVLWELGSDVISIGNAPNGRNINKASGVVDPAHMCQRVREARADLGIALDGDADRVILADAEGRCIDGDQVLAALTWAWLDAGRLKCDGIVATVMSNLGLERWLNAQGLKLHRTQVGDRYVSQHMRQGGFNIGGENSGHVVLADFSTTGDGLITALQILAIMQRQQKSAAQICAQFEPIPQITQNVALENKKTVLEKTEVKTLIEQAQIKLGQGRLLVRPSGTEALVRIMAEGENPDLLRAIVGDLAEAISVHGASHA